jgi:hypothetical protein
MTRFHTFAELMDYRNEQLLCYERGEISSQKFKQLVRKAVNKYRRGLTLAEAYRLERHAEVSFGR